MLDGDHVPHPRYPCVRIINLAHLPLNLQHQSRLMCPKMPLAVFTAENAICYGRHYYLTSNPQECWKSEIDVEERPCANPCTMMPCVTSKNKRHDTTDSENGPCYHPNMCNPEHVTGVEPMLINVVQQHCNMGEVGGVSWGDWGRGRGSDGSLHDPCSVNSSVRGQSMGEKEWSAPPVSVPTGHWYMILLVRTVIHIASPHLRWWSRGSQALIVA